MTITPATHCQIERAFVITSFIYARINGKNYKALRHVDGLQVESLNPGDEVTEEIVNCFNILNYKLCLQSH